jgi:hypothetical protein
MRGMHDLLVDADLSSYKKSSKKELPPMFPYYEEKFKFDPYGEIIKYSFLLYLLKNDYLNLYLILDKTILLNLKQPQEMN